MRGVAPLAAAAQIFSDRNPGLQIEVVPHSARQFGEGPIEALAREFDIIVFDHPLTGSAVRSGCFLPLDDFLSRDVIEEREAHSVGGSFESYIVDGRVWGLPLDAACMVSAWRPDLCENPPQSWDQLLDLAETGAVVQGFSRMTTTAMYFMLRNSGDTEELAEQKLLQLYLKTGKNLRLEQGSIQTLEEISGSGSGAFVPACYGYSNYTRPGFSINPLVFGPCLLAPDGGAVLGGAGVAVSASSSHREMAVAFAEWITGANCQTFVYAVCGGQPAHAQAWDADLPNSLTRDFYRNLRNAMEAAWVRPNHPDFHHEQSAIADRLMALLRAA